MEPIPISAAVLSISDTRLEDDDVSGVTLVGLLLSINARVTGKYIVPDELTLIKFRLLELCDRGDVNLIVTTGGTGLSPRDNTPEATREVIEREAPGLAEAMRRETVNKTPLAMLSRGVCGIRGKALIINLPGSPKAVTECFEVIRPVIPHAIDQLGGNTKHQ